ncbi:hypothetical protein VTI74DRAFT_9648 [Chaetomium olivicolor]
MIACQRNPGASGKTLSLDLQIATQSPDKRIDVPLVIPCYISRSSNVSTKPDFCLVHLSEVEVESSSGRTALLLAQERGNQAEGKATYNIVLEMDVKGMLKTIEVLLDFRNDRRPPQLIRAVVDRNIDGLGVCRAIGVVSKLEGAMAVMCVAVTGKSSRISNTLSRIIGQSAANMAKPGPSGTGERYMGRVSSGAIISIATSKPWTEAVASTYRLSWTTILSHTIEELPHQRALMMTVSCIFQGSSGTMRPARSISNSST